MVKVVTAQVVTAQVVTVQVWTVQGKHEGGAAAIPYFRPSAAATASIASRSKSCAAVAVAASV